jgi:glycosyltransferase involved in cell wall biosynthesis
VRIAHISPTFPPDKGGMGNAAYHMAMEGLKRGHEIVVFTPRYAAGPEEESYNGLRVIRLSPFLQYGKAAFVPQLFFRLGGFDILHLHYPFFGGAEAVWLSRVLRKKGRLVISYHMDVVGTGLKAFIFKAYTKLLLGKIVSSADKIVVSSCDYAEHSYISGLVKAGDTVEIPYGIDERFTPREREASLLERWDIKQDELVILFMGGFEYFKGIDRLIRSLTSVKGNIKVLIAGDGELRPSYEKLARDLGVADRVRFPGAVEDRDIIDYFNLCDIFILPSLDRTEAFGIVLIEAMACEKPVVAADLPGVRTVVDDGINGLLVAPGDIADIAAKLQLLIEREDLRREFGRRGREKVLQKYLWRIVGDGLDEVYAEVLSRPAGPA